MYRGRGALEVNRSTNPFFQTTSSDLGSDPQENIQWRHNINPSFLQTAVDSEKKEDFSFLYRRTSDTIGGRLEKTKPFLPQQMTKTEFLKTRREHLQQNIDSVPMDIIQMKRTVQKPDPVQVLTTYKHETKFEDPRYTTAANEIGKKTPTIATFVAERATRQQEFSRSFGNIKPKNSNLNTSISKSNIHPKLDPQFV